MLTITDKEAGASHEIEIIEIPYSDALAGYRHRRRRLRGAFAAQANEKTFVYVNGYELTPQELYVAQQRSGAHIPPGHYLYDGQSGCWVELNSGRGGCPGNTGGGSSGGGSYISRYGSGEWNGSGDWNHWSNATGGAVGGTNDGCIYTSFGWSNC